MGRVGPSLAGFGRRQVIAGYFANSRPNLIRWVARSQAMLPGNAMPNSGLTPAQAAKVADYLYTLDE
jgi:cytochrome c1